MKNKAVDFIVEHLGAVLAVYHENDSHEIAWLNLSKVALPEIAEVMDFQTFKIYAAIVRGLNEKIPFLYVMDRLAELEHVKKELCEIQLINKQLNTKNAQQETRKANEQSNETLNNDKQKMIIAGWSIQESHGYFRAFKRIAGKMKGVYLGKTLEDAEKKIRGKEKNLQSGK
jgi:hypothetical protein